MKLSFCVAIFTLFTINSPCEADCDMDLNINMKIISVP